MLSLMIIVSIFIAIMIGYKTNINTGLIAIGFSYIIGCLVMDMPVREVLGGWPLNTMFVIFSVSLFYNFAMINGTLDATARFVLYKMQRYPALLPLAIYFASAFIAALGAGFFTVMAAMAPLALLICKEAKINELVGAMAVNCGALSGANFMTSGSGIIFRGLMSEIDFDQEAFGYSGFIFIMSVIFSILLITSIMFFHRKTNPVEGHLTIDKPEPLTHKQKQNLWLIIFMVIVVLIFPIMHMILPEHALITSINSKMDVGFVAIIFAIIALLMDLAPQIEAMNKVPWNTIIMISGVGMLINVAIEAGTIEQLAAWVGGSIPVLLIPLALAIIAAIMSFFSSTLGVVAPALFPLVPSLAEVSGANPMLLFMCIVIGAQSSAISPFSSGGSLVLGSASTEEERQRLFPQLIFKAVPISVLSAAAFCFIVSLFNIA